MQESGNGRRRQSRSGDNVASSSRVKLDDDTALYPSNSTQTFASGRLERRVLAEREHLLQSRQQELEEVLNTHDDLVSIHLLLCSTVFVVLTTYLLRSENSFILRSSLVCYITTRR